MYQLLSRMVHKFNFPIGWYTVDRVFLHPIIMTSSCQKHNVKHELWSEISLSSIQCFATTVVKNTYANSSAVIGEINGIEYVYLLILSTKVSALS